MKKALILGVGAAQLDAIRCLKQQGWWVIGCSYRREGLGVDAVNQFELVDIRDVAALEALAGKERVELIYSVGSDLAMLPVATVADRLGLVTLLPPQAAVITGDKVRLRQFLNENRVSPVPCRRLESANRMEGWPCFPAMVKPSCSQGQRGVVKVHSMEEAKAVLAGVMAHSTDGTAIIEPYLEGPEISVNLILHHGRRLFGMISERHVLPDVPGGIPQRHVVPAAIPDGTADEVLGLAALAAKALKINEGPVYFQLKLTPDGPKILEIAPRLDGCHLWRLIQTATGVDILELVLNLLQQKEVPDTLTPIERGTYSLHFLFNLPGTVFDPADYRLPADVTYSEFYYRRGETIRPVNGRMEKVGYYIAAQDRS